MASKTVQMGEQEDVAVDSEPLGTDKSLLIGALLAIFLRLLGIVVYVPRHPGDGYAFFRGFRAVALLRVLQSIAMVIVGGDLDEILLHATVGRNGQVLPGFFIVRQIVEFNHQGRGKVPSENLELLILSRFYHEYSEYSLGDDGFARVARKQEPTPDVQDSFSRCFNVIRDMCPIRAVSAAFEVVIPDYLSVGNARESLVHECGSACRIDKLFSEDLLWRVMHTAAVALSVGPPEPPGGLTTIPDPPMGVICSDGRKSLGPSRSVLAVSRWEACHLPQFGTLRRDDPIHIQPTFAEGLFFVDGDFGECGLCPELQEGIPTSYFEVFTSGPSFGVTCFDSGQTQWKQRDSVKKGVPPWADWCFNQDVFDSGYKPLGGNPQPRVALPPDIVSW